MKPHASGVFCTCIFLLLLSQIDITKQLVVLSRIVSCPGSFDLLEKRSGEKEWISYSISDIPYICIYVFMGWAILLVALSIKDSRNGS